jgi:hypothetical protein
MTTLCTASYRAWRPWPGSTPVVTSLTRPNWIPEAAGWPALWPVTPRWSYFRAGPEEFERRYVSQLERYGAKRIVCELALITRQTGASTLVLLCWEWGGPDGGRDRCHRGIWARWWLESTGEIVEEILP